jgi:polyhydroxybutyrate depolymerase
MHKARVHFISLMAVAAFGAFAGMPVRANEVLTIVHQGAARTAVMHRPKGVNEPRPLVVALHGLSGTGASMRPWSGFDAVADREKFTVVYPDAVEKSWSYGRPINLPMPTIGGETVDDVGFIRLLIGELVARKVADPDRIYIAGVSRGGLMAYTLACALADRIAAAAPLIHGMTEYQREDCRPVRPVPILVLAGTRDSAFGNQGRTGRLLSISETMGFWRTLHGCTRRTPVALPHRDETDATRVEVVTWTGCASGKQIVLYRVIGGGHQLPSLVQHPSPLSVEKFGRRNRDFETAEAVWAFFKGDGR